MRFSTRILLTFAAAFITDVSCDSFSSSTCKNGLATCTNVFDSSSHDKGSLLIYLQCLQSIDCSSTAEDRADHEKMLMEVTWSIENYNEFDYDRASGCGKILFSRYLITVPFLTWFYSRSMFNII